MIGCYESYILKKFETLLLSLISSPKYKIVLSPNLLLLLVWGIVLYNTGKMISQNSQTRQ